MNEWSVYLIECEDGSFYTGITNNVEKRFEAHCKGKGAKYTKAHKPIRLVWSKIVGTKGDALRAEHNVRKLKRSEKIVFGLNI